MSDRDSVVTVDELDETTGEDLQAGGNDHRQGHGRVEGEGWAPRGNRGGWSDGYGRPGPGGDGQYNQQQPGELGSKILHIQSKKFYIDLKESRRGRFVKISEVSQNGNRNRMTMELASAIELHEKLTDFIQEYSKLGPRSSSIDGPRVSRVKSETIFATERRYYLDLKENRAGRFLKIAMTMPPPNFDRCEIVIPAQGMVDLRDAIVDLLNEFGGKDAIKKDPDEKNQSSDARDKNASKEEDGLTLKASGKTFYLSVGSNTHGTHLKISEVCPNFRTAVNIPHEYWGRFLEILKKNVASGGSGAEGGEAKDETMD